MKTFLLKISNIRSGELKRVLLMAGYIFVIIASYNVLKPMTRSLFVSNMGLEQLPYLYMILAVVVGLFIIGYLRVSAKLKLDWLLNTTILFLMGNLILFWWFLKLEIHSPILYYSLFIWASIYGVLTTTQFWLMANYVFNAREAKRLFPILTSSALTGAIMGGYFTRFLVKQIGGTANLAFFCIALLGAALVLLNMAWRNRDTSIETSRRMKTPKGPDHSFRIVAEISTLVRDSKHLAFLMAIVGLTYIVVQLADFQFIAFASKEIADTDDLTAFLGFWLSNLSIFALAFQLVFVRLILSRFGVGVTIMFLPLALLITSAWVYLSYGLVSILAIKVGDGAFRHSINKVGMELLYLPIPPEVKKKTKAFIDMFVDRFARGTAGLILLVFYTWLGFSIAQISLISISLISIWILLSIATYREYVNSFRQAIDKQRIDIDAVSLSIKDTNTINSLLISLTSQNERQVVYALQLLESASGVDLEPPLHPLLQHKSPAVRRQALQLTYRQNLKQLSKDVKLLLADADEDVRQEAVRVYVEFSEERNEDILKNWLSSSELGLRGATLHYLAEQPNLARKLLSDEIIQSFLNEGSEGRALVATVLGTLSDKTYRTYLNDLLTDPRNKVRTRAIRSAGQTGSAEFIPILLENLEIRTYRKAARQALALYGEAVIADLNRYLNDKKVASEIRTEIPRVLSLIGTQKSVDVLLDNLILRDESLRYDVIKALNRLRARFPEHTFDKRVDEALQDELRKYYRILKTLHLSEAETNGDDSGLLNRALAGRREDHIERIFRLLALRYPPKDIYNAFAATTSQNPAIRANAIEFLDNILSKNHKRILLPVVEDLPIEQVLQKADGLVDGKITNRMEALKSLASSGDAWLRACALYEIGITGLTSKFKTEISKAENSTHTLVKETARLVLEKFA